MVVEKVHNFLHRRYFLVWKCNEETASHFPHGFWKGVPKVNNFASQYAKSMCASSAMFSGGSNFVSRMYLVLPHLKFLSSFSFSPSFFMRKGNRSNKVFWSAQGSCLVQAFWVGLKRAEWRYFFFYWTTVHMSCFVRQLTLLPQYRKPPLLLSQIQRGRQKNLFLIASSGKKIRSNSGKEKEGG